jgi:t-SNARE complex subunit (syntaxin)
MKNLVQTLIGAALIGAASTMWGFSKDISSLNRTVYFLEDEIKEIKGNQKEILNHLLEIRKK